MLAFGKLRQEDCEFENNLNYMARPCLKRTKDDDDDDNNDDDDGDENIIIVYITGFCNENFAQV